MQLARVAIAGLAGDTGKTLVSVGVTAALRRRGRKVAPFKKGPDFIDAAWLGLAADAPGRNLDSFLMGPAALRRSLGRVGQDSDIAVMEGNRGLFDGMDVEGSHSTAELCRGLGFPVVLVIDVTKVTRTSAALVLGCQSLDPGLWLAGVVLNRVGTGRQEQIIREVLGRYTDVPVLGAIPRVERRQFPSRHLGLVPPAERVEPAELVEAARELVEQYVDLDELEQVARRARDLEPAGQPSETATGSSKVRIGVLRDRAFSFYYPENLESLQEEGAEIVPISPLDDEELPEVDALYAGGGFPEVYADRLAANGGFREQLRARIAAGLPVWAECGGLMYLSRCLVSEGATYDMVGALPLVVEQRKRPQGHGYVLARVDRENPFLSRGEELRGHEFHYSRVVDDPSSLTTVMSLSRGNGVGGGRDGIRVGSVLASYTHVHALGAPQWAHAVVEQAAGPN